jgi:hypothetical protein
MTAILAILLLMTTGIDLSNVKLPSLEAVRAERVRRRPLWKPQHAEGCAYYWAHCVCGTPREHEPACGFLLPMPSASKWKAAPCHCPQAMAFYSDAQCIGFGGQAGGGKSHWIIGMAATQHRKAVIFRREGKENRDLFETACEVVGDHGDKNLTEKLIRNLPGDRRIEFAGVKNPGDWVKHRGIARDGHYFDEGTEFEEIMIRSLSGWNRTTIIGQRCRVGISFNPPSIKRGQWLKRFFAPWIDPKHPNPATSGEIRWFTTVNGEEVECENGEPIEITERGKTFMVRPTSRTFIRSTLDDNAYLKNSGYRETLLALPEPLRSQLAFGDMNVEESDDAHQLIPTRWVQLAQDRWLKRNGRPDGPLSALGSDPAHGGDDDNVVAPRIGGWFDFPETKPGKDTPDGRDTLKFLAEVASKYRVNERSLPVGMDIIGVGASPRDLAKDTNIQLVPMNSSERDPEATDRYTGMLYFATNRAMWWWRLREALDPEKGEDLELPPDQELLVDLTAPLFDLGPRGITVEGKDEIRKKIGRSPGKGDAVVYAYNVRPMIIGYQTITPRRSLDPVTPRKPTNPWKKKGFS